MNSAITYRDEDVLDSTEFRTARFHGSFDPSRDKSRPQFVALVDYERSNPNSLEIRLIWNGDERERADAAAWLRFRKRNHLWLYPVDSNELPVEVLGITSTSHNLHEGTIVATAASFGITDNASGDAAKYQLHVKLQPSGILVFPAIVTHDFTGEITRDPIEDGVIEIATTVGTLVARETHEYTNSLKFGDSVLHQAQRASISGEIVLPKGQSLFAVHEVLQREIEDICAAMSLCYRQEVTFYEFEYFPLGQHQQILSATYRRRRMARARIKIEELIHATALADGGLQKLVSALRSTKSPDAVHRAISFLAGSYETDLEVAYFMAFSAMETVLGSCGEQDDLVIVPDDKWNRLERSLRETLAREGNALAMSVEHLLRRLPELRRPSLAQRMARICENFGAKSADLWPDEGFADGFARAVATRNGLFHAAKDIANQSAHGDLVRIRTLTERLILKLLDWPEEKLWVWRDDWLGRVNCP